MALVLYIAAAIMALLWLLGLELGALNMTALLFLLVSAGLVCSTAGIGWPRRTE